MSVELNDLGRVHFIGIGGAGMSGIVRIMLARGISVSGSDAKESAGLLELGALGASVHAGHAAQNVAGADTVVISTAIRANNPELEFARTQGLRVLHRSEALAAAMAQDTVVAVAGTHGKTTTTAMIAVLLREAGLDPSFAVGGTVPALGVNAAHGAGGIFVAEADESDGSFLNYRPQIAVVTNAEPDHLDHYGTAEAVMEAFQSFIGLIPADGLLVACTDDDGALALAKQAAARGTRVVTYGRSAAAEVWLINDGAHRAIEFITPIGPQRLVLELQVPGEHNALNALAAFAVALELGVEAEQALSALAGFTGAARRFEFKGQVRGIRVFDDYAHHPTEVRAALTAARTVADGHHVLVLFQPHLFSRTHEFAAEFAAALSLADSIMVLDVYPAREDPIPGVTGELITEANAKLTFQPDRAKAIQELVARTANGDIVLTVGAGDVTEAGAAILDALATPAQEVSHGG
ncbi:UDP-N-acetylmuramate--alanine ligase [Renibacterium salmoninarum ATCC 33209]|uniref:UDP-N-acetylmuramate--L-alanine ligase n=1 Tax=Renibacterium salmoninarum (strain ATCC 33209 / DSM 20767 / JCM 11484 / NBRC 15589 / NCIMB 2235) TaxID=288705 RepID=MURC_RENSM|nr:UDP-N-acetylmuramate--L-alanine ligase [Renibacterium salmoninarum]A9WRD7.1 RecName: Full=UDP-N-acetylmuramate--L-alanine ligase; AltName: Full=UDP-N-acetylmuramoyl-L-alanine synthetase [Renibacterium salmoninarum ATCC 33209]ABY24219.1 UDP-N-acetylmuramate--alanine ligase [Renibacterium salmoninarum ATCC 33209]